jgi:hypothetical protein
MYYLPHWQKRPASNQKVLGSTLFESICFWQRDDDVSEDNETFDWMTQCQISPMGETLQS